MQIQLSEQIRELRRRDGRTQEDLADALGVTAQAVSRWEKGICYPDMEMMPALANYFGVTIDELFGYHNERAKKVDETAEHILAMNRMNNGEDVNMDECIQLAREALAEFPGSDKLMLCLASVLYNAGYVRYGEFHLIDDEGYGVYDVGRHREYAEWREAIKLYEKVLPTLEDAALRRRAVAELTQLYLNMGEHDRAMAIADAAPDIHGSRPFLRINACDGKAQARAYAEALLDTIHAAAGLILGGVMSNQEHLTPAEKADGVSRAIGLFELVCADGNFGVYHGFIARMNTLLSVYLWLDERHDEAFAALDRAEQHYRTSLKIAAAGKCSYSAPLLRLVENDWVELSTLPPISLAEDWPWWSVQEYSLVKEEIQADPRWEAWVNRLKTEC